MHSVSILTNYGEHSHDSVTLVMRYPVTGQNGISFMTHGLASHYPSNSTVRMGGRLCFRSGCDDSVMSGPVKSRTTDYGMDRPVVCF